MTRFRDALVDLAALGIIAVAFMLMPIGRQIFLARYEQRAREREPFDL